MRIRQLDDAASDAYERFLAQRSGALFFQSWRYMEVLKDLLGAGQRTLLAIDEASNIAGALPLMSREGRKGTVLNSLPYYGSNGGLMANGLEARTALLTAFNEISSDTSVCASTLVTNPLEEVDYSGLEYNLTDARIGQFTPIAFLDRHSDRLMEMFHHKTRNMVRKAEKLGVAVATDEGEMDFLVQTHAENMMEVGGRPKNAAFFGLVARRFKHGPEYRIYVARIGGQPVAAVLLFYYNGTVEYFTPVVRKEYRETQALSLAIYRAMCDASIAGFRWWNWGGTWSSQEGVYRFKKRWGTQDRPYTYFVRLNDESLRRLKAQALLDAYPDFFVLPFSQLETPMEAH